MNGSKDGEMNSKAPKNTQSKTSAGKKSAGVKIRNVAAAVNDVAVEKEVSEAFVAYSLSVISSRAIPNVKDGLKPVQRRILYSMFNMGIRPDTPHRKCARVVGDTMGNYHPHGDAAIYDALVRMGQNFSRRAVLIDPQGNFGSLDDPPAASRYTECRLTEAALSMLSELNEDTVNFRPTYDGESLEPAILPGKLPNLLLNGAAGIAVGMTTNMVPHNLGEIYEAVRMVLNKNNPKPKIEELMSVMPGPDFPGGGILIDDGLKEIYRSRTKSQAQNQGKGSFRLRAKSEIVPLTPKRQAIMITELPYLVGPEKVVSKIKELMLADKLPEVSDVKNLSDRHKGLELQIECRPDANPAAVLQKLWKLTPLEEIHNINNVALVNGVPTNLSLYDMCRHYINHRLEVIVRRTKHRLRLAKERLHIVEGLVNALDNLDLVIKIIRGSKTAEDAKKELRAKLKLTIIQAESILQMRLRRLTALEREKIIDEKAQLKKDIAGYNSLLDSKKKQSKLVETELKELSETHSTPRRTQIISSEEVQELEMPPPSKKAVPAQKCVLTHSTSGAAGWAPIEEEEEEYTAKPGRHDVIKSFTYTDTIATAWAFTSEGRCLSMPVSQLGQIEGRFRGSPADKAFGTNAGEKILMITAQDTQETILAVTASGSVKHLSPSFLESFRSGNSYINLKGNDKAAAVIECPAVSKSLEIILISDKAKALKFKLSDIKTLGPNAAGIAGLKLKDGSQAVGAGCCLGDSQVVVVTNQASAKVTPLEEIPSMNRGGMGVRLCSMDDPDMKLELVYIGALEGLTTVVASETDPSRADPAPADFGLQPTEVGNVPQDTERQILALGVKRWQA